MVADPYKTLGLPHTATPTQIKKSYHALARKYHPDRLQPNVKTVSEVDFARIAEAYILLSDPQRKAQYDHIYQYGGYDDDKSRPDNSFPRKKRSRNGVGYACNDPVFTYLFSQGKVHSTRAVAGIKLPSRLAMNQVRLAFSSGQVWSVEPETRIYQSQTIHYERGQQYTRTKKTIQHKDGRREVILIDKDEQGHSKRKYFILNGKPIDDRDSTWYTNTWQEVKDSFLMCYAPCTAVTN
jgi:curved DNA-binding protein CbpA